MIDEAHSLLYTECYMLELFPSLNFAFSSSQVIIKRVAPTLSRQRIHTRRERGRFYWILQLEFVIIKLSHSCNRCAEI